MRRLWWGVVALAAALRLSGLGHWGFVDPYFAAGVRTMTGGGSSFWYGAFDSGGFLTVDKPPLAFWLQTVFCWLLGFSNLALCLPQALAGVGSVWLLGKLVARRSGESAGLLSALALALTPICVAADKTNLVDSLLAFVLLCAAWALFGALETGRLRGLLLCAALIGVGVHVKAGAAFAIVPAFGLAYLSCGPGDIKKRIGQLVLTLPVLLAVSSIWMLAVDSTPPEQRPFIGSSKDNSARYQVFVHYGVRRLIGPPPSPPVPPKSGLYNVQMGPLRLFQRELADQLFWWLPLACLGLWQLGKDKKSRADVIVWGGWMLVYLASFSYVRDVFHPYYLPPLAIATAALVGIGAKNAPKWLLGLTALWQVWLLSAYPSWVLWLAPFVLLGMRWPVLLSLAPLAWCASAAFTWCNSPLVYAGPLRLTTGGPDPSLIATPQLWQGKLTDADRPKLLAFLKKERRGEKFLLAVQSTVPAAPVILRTGEAVMALGGFTGGDPILTPESLAQRVRRGEVRFFLLPPQNTAFGHNGALMEWVRNHGLLVEPALWRDSGNDLLLYEVLF
ncbi:glycosyltransferase family 39 protein [Armatimonas sp.]|uniref:ArnT family glycosyltransferase n=1 Tax=Armatimonas sp. TaxID=1872638 RepID=UPI00286AB00F|nr:glycosyltransferase family 39 protein [Armatimonas sp.]